MHPSCTARPSRDHTDDLSPAVRRRRTHVALLLLSVALVGCLDRDLAVLTPRISRSIDDVVRSKGTPNVDLLIVIDDSGSMKQEQALIAEQIPLLVRGLTSPPDDDGDGEPDWNAVESLRVAVTTTDVGTAGAPRTDIGRCGLGAGSTHADAWGRDGRFRTDAACGASGPVQTWTSEQDPDAFAARVGCLAEAGISGCGIEQPLLAAARSLERDDAGFPREDALLAVLVVTDEEDCSLSDPSTFFGDLPKKPSAANVHCTRHPDRLAPIEDLVERVKGERSDEEIVFAALAGVPLDLVEQQPAEILSDPRMAYVEAPENDSGLRYACETYAAEGTARSLATPARRLVALAEQLDGALVRSICEESFQPAIAELTRRIGAQITGACLGRSLTPAADGSVPCDVLETLPPGMACSRALGRAPWGEDEEGREVCRVAQQPDGDAPGWFYDVSDLACDRITFTEGALPPFEASIRFQCLVEVETPDAVGVP